MMAATHVQAISPGCMAEPKIGEEEKEGEEEDEERQGFQSMSLRN